LGTAPTWANFFVAIPLCMLAYTGIETISNMSEEAKDPGKTVPKAINRVVIAVFAIYALLPAIALSALPVRCVGTHCTTLLGVDDQHGGYAGDPVLGVVRALHLGALQHAAEIYVGLLAATILFIATNAGMIGISRLSWSLSEHRQLPQLFSQLHAKYRTPWFTLIFFSMLASTLIIYGNTSVLGNLYSFGAMLSFTTAHASIVKLRVSDPDRERPYKSPWGVRIKGAVIPMTAVIGGIGTAAAWVAVTILHTEAKIVGIPWMVLGMAGYFYYRHRQGLNPRKGYRIERPQRPADFEELEYKTALVPIFGDDVSASALSSAAKLIGAEGVVYAIYVLPVPSQLSLEAGLEEEEAHGRSVLESARIQARRAGIKIHTGLIRTRNPGAALVEEAERVGSDVIYWSTIHAPAGEQGIGPTAAYLLSKRPCRVIIETEKQRARVPAPA
ncbi:MAG TPA: APC family permease, partial [Solirubrobacteraceae bacterium]|nr:APC family permease [Solirubrobacteraceae bacterium]